MPWLIVAAETREIAGIRKQAGGRWLLAANGPGALAAQALRDKRNVEGIVSTGFCGALDESLRVGDVVVALGVRDETVRDESSIRTRTYETLVPGVGNVEAVLSGAIVSIHHIARTAAEKRNLRATGASIVDMEAAGVARAAEDLGLPFYCIRAVSDLAGEDFENDFDAALGPDGRFSIMRLLRGAVASPRKRLGELIRLQQRTALATKKLGDFLADCTFQ